MTSSPSPRSKPRLKRAGSASRWDRLAEPKKVNEPTYDLGNKFEWQLRKREKEKEILNTPQKPWDGDKYILFWSEYVEFFQETQIFGECDEAQPLMELLADFTVTRVLFKHKRNLSAASPSDVYRESPTKTITVPLVVGDYIETYAPMKVDNSKMWGEVTELSGDNVHVRVHQQEPTTPLEFNMRFPKEECTKITKNTPSDADEAAEGFSPEPLSASCFGRNLDVELERAKELEDLQHLVKVKNNEVVEVKQEMNETVAKIEERYAEELAKIRASYGGVEVNRVRDEAVAKVIELQENMEELQKRILELESQKQIWAEKKEHQSDDVAGLNRQVYELNAKKEALAEQVVNLIVERDQHSNSMAALVQIEVSQLGDELRDTRDALLAARDELREKNTQIVGFQDTIIQRDLEKHNLLNQLEDLGNEYATFRHNVEDQKSNVQEVEKGPIIHHVEAKPSNSRIFWDGIICLVFMLLGAFLCLFGLRSYDMLKYDHFANPIN
eukprot:128409_1